MAVLYRYPEAEPGNRLNITAVFSPTHTDGLLQPRSELLDYPEVPIKDASIDAQRVLGKMQGDVLSLVTAPRLSVPVSLDSPAMVAAQVPDAVW